MMDKQAQDMVDLDTQSKLVECDVFTPGTIFETVFEESWIIGKNDIMATEWTKEGLQVSLNGLRVRSRTMVVCGGDKDKQPSKQGYHDVWEFYKDE
jgi:hypothetical protein